MKRSMDWGPKTQLSPEDIRGLGRSPDDGLLVTHVNQTFDLLRLRGVEAQPPEEDDPRVWLSAHSLEFEKLTLADPATPVREEGSSAQRNPHFSTQATRQLEWKLSEMIGLYQQRIQWLSESSRKAFGLVEGTSVGLLVDSAMLGGGPRREEFLRDLGSLIDEQLSHKERLFVLTFGTTTSALWPDPVAISASRLLELRLWVKTPLLPPPPEGGSNLLQALRKAFAVKGLDSLVAVLGSCPDQAPEILSDYIHQAALGRGLRTHLVTYQCEDRVPPTCTSADVEELRAEMQRAQHLLGRVHALHHGAASPEPPGWAEEISTEIAQGLLRALPSKPPKHEAPLTIEFPSLDKTSAEWLKVNGLRAKKLCLYQVLAPNAFAPIVEFVPVLQKTVSSTVHEVIQTRLSPNSMGKPPCHVPS